MENLQEKKLHGHPDFPFAVYPGKIPEFTTAYPLHYHEELELIYIQSGTGVVRVQAEQFIVQPGDLVVVPPQVLHNIRQLGQADMDYYTILFRLSLLEQNPQVGKYTAVLWNREKELPVFLPREHGLNQAMMPSVQALLEYREKRDTAFDLMVYSHLYRIVYHLVHQWEEAAGDRIRVNTNYEKLKVVLDHLKTRSAEELPVPAAAAMCGFSESHFMRLFRELTGTSFAQYVKQLRLYAAAELLRTTGKRIGEIAEETGFRNISYFTRAFGEKYHMTPSDYRAARQ